MSLSQGEVDVFMSAAKAVPGDGPMAWKTSPAEHRWWRGPVEVDGQRVGEVYLGANPALVRSFNFKLSFRGEEVYRLDIRPGPARHSNTGCPDTFPRKVRAKEHQHVFIEGRNTDCARPVEDLETANDIEIFAEFCRRTNLSFRPTYGSPLVNEPLRLI